MDERVISRTGEGTRTFELVGKPGGDPELFIDGIHGFVALGAHVKMNLYSVAMTSPEIGTEGVERREVVSRLVMTIPSFIAVAKFLNDRLADLRAEGLVVVDPASNAAGTHKRSP